MPLTTGFIGLGAMGAHMARHLHHRGLLTAVWNRTSTKSEALAADLGVRCAASLADMAEHCEAIVLCVAADADVLQVVDALIPKLRPNSIVIDCSTVSADTARTAAHRLAERGIGFLDAPVSGGVEGARKGSLAIMVGGEVEVFARVKPVLDAMGTTVTHFGETGSGQAAKATNQLMCAGIIQAISEAMAFAKAEGLPLEKIIDTLGNSAGARWYFVNRAPNMVKGEYPPGLRVQLHQKDMKICREMAARHGVQLPLIEMTLVHYRRLIDQGYGDDDISAVF